MRPPFAGHLEGLFHRLVLRAAHDFENGVRPVAAGQVLDSGNRIVLAYVYRLIRAHLPRHFQPVRHRVDGDDAGACVFRGGERAQAHRPHADDGYRLARLEPRAVHHDVIARAQRLHDRSRGVVQFIRQGQHGLRGRYDVPAVAAVHVHADGARVVAQVHPAHLAEITFSAVHVVLDAGPRADFHAFGARTQRAHHAHELMARHDGIFRAPHVAVDQVKIAAAYRAGADFDEHLAGAGFGCGTLHEFEPPRFVQKGGE